MLKRSIDLYLGKDILLYEMKSRERCWQCKREESNKKKKQEIKYALSTLITFLGVVNLKKKKNKSNLSDIWRQLDTMHTSFCCFFANFTIFRTREVDICTKRFVLLNFILLILFSCLFFMIYSRTPSTLQHD